MLAGLTSLKELACWHNHRMTGNISSLRPLKDTLEKVNITFCANVKGNFMDLADFPHLEELNLIPTAVTGDIRDIGENDFPAIDQLDLPQGVYGGYTHEIQGISDAPELIRAVYLLKKQRPGLNMMRRCGRLSEDSTDWYAREDNRGSPPFDICFVEAGCRFGYQWCAYLGEPCEVNWIDPEPDRESFEYEEYIEEVRQFHQVEKYRGFYQPPSEEEYHNM